ncbi:MAG: alanine racemase [Frankia sp.]
MTTPGPAGLLTRAVADAAVAIDGPTYLYDLTHLDGHARAIRAALPPGIEVLYAVKANPDPRLLAVLERHVDGWEVASGGELAHLRRHVPGRPAYFAGPGKTDAELAAALAAGVTFHVESAEELRRLDALVSAAGTAGRAAAGRSRAAVLLRVNLPVPAGLPLALAMGGRPSPFGMDPAEADACGHALAAGALSGIDFRGVHAHLASGLDAPACADMADVTLRWAVGFGARHRLRVAEIDVGGGMTVDYRRPWARFDWTGYGERLSRTIRAVGAGAVVRIEPGRSLTAYSGWYATRIVDLKLSHGQWFAIVAGGTHHLRTPVAKGHDQPFAVLPTHTWTRPWPRSETSGPVTVVGQLCTPKDVLAREVPVDRVGVGDVVVFALAGAYGFTISHHDFLMHPRPAVRHVS